MAALFLDSGQGINAGASPRTRRPLPSVIGLLDTISRAIDSEERVPGAVIAMKLVSLPVLLEFRLKAVNLIGSRIAILVAEDAEEWRLQRPGVSMAGTGRCGVSNALSSTITPLPQQLTAASNTSGARQAQR